MIRALIPAAGHSARMGRPKLALPLGGRTVLERVIDALREAEIESILVVTAPHSAGLAPMAESAGATVLRLPQSTPDMRATIEAGLHCLEQTLRPTMNDAILLVPADHPALDADVIRSLRSEWLKHPECSIAVPTHAGARGHPAIIGWRHVPGIRAFDKDRGLNAYLRQFAAETLEVPVDSPDVLVDLDTRQDYERLRKRFTNTP